jgi:hypothetical protein
MSLSVRCTRILAVAAGAVIAISTSSAAQADGGSPPSQGSGPNAARPSSKLSQARPLPASGSARVVLTQPSPSRARKVGKNRVLRLPRGTRPSLKAAVPYISHYEWYSQSWSSGWTLYTGYEVNVDQRYTGNWLNYWYYRGIFQSSQYCSAAGCRSMQWITR